MITINNLNFSYRRDRLFAGLNMELREGSIYGLLGRNGAGKSTLLKLISGLIFPSDGEIKVMGYTPRDRDKNFLGDMFFVPEEFDLPRMSGETFSDVYGKFYPKFSISDFQSHARMLDVECGRSMNDMSFGQKKKIFIAFALACNTRLLILDEPTNGLDIPSKSKLRTLLSSIDLSDKVVIISTHQVRDLNQLIDAITIIDNGEIVVNSTVSALSELFAFKLVDKSATGVIYSEPSLHGEWGLLKNTDHTETTFDMELFFNAVISNKEIIKKYLCDVK